MKPLEASDPTAVGPYRVLAELGRGGMGRVFLGSGSDGRLVAVKQVRQQFVEDEGFRARFRREVDASRRVSGAYTAAVIDADEHAPLPWLASVFVSGPSLRHAIDVAGALAEEPVRRLAAGLAAALVEIHRAGLIHRDLKPSNVLLAADGPRVIDFGIARATDSPGGSEITHTGWLVGSPGFMSPEQAEGRPLTPASDVFSLGTVLVMACTGVSPFAGSSTPQTLYNVVHREPDLAAVPETLRGIIESCLAKDPARRPRPAQLLESIGHLAPSAQVWPTPVHDLITSQQAEVARLLGVPLEQPAPPPAVPPNATPPHDPTLAYTRQNPGPPPAVPDARIRRRGPLLAVIGALVGVAVLAGAVIWALPPSSRPAGGARALIGVTMPTKSSERWTRDGDIVKSRLKKLGYQVDLQYAEDDMLTQASQIENQINKGAKLLIVASVDDTALTSQLQQAADKKIPVIAYDRLIRNSPNVDYYVTYDSFQVGVQQATSLLAGLGVDKGEKGPFNVELFGGSPVDNSAMIFWDGAMSVLKPKIDSGTLKVASGQTDFKTAAILNWDSATAQARMEDILTKTYAGGKRVDGVLSPYDGLSIGILSALKSNGYGTSGRPYPIVTGQDAELASVKSIVAGEQYSTILKDTHKLAATTVAMADAVLKGGKPEVNNTKDYDNGTKVVPSYLLDPVIVDKSNYEQILIGGNYYTANQLK
ncbi:multiple monosaccharide ABC transporter substrate-binding protein [Nonomuraea sp. H19]|uniref:multiple monosaccharide ABC transporter substrate-binding protein n=1 Tax=Nonomuraea sp. H19 TaxID=3452206 RepID=UPI003F887A69